MDNTQVVNTNDVTTAPVSAPESVPQVSAAPNAGTTPIGVRPTWLKEKFKDPEHLATSYDELESKLGSTFGAPQDYDCKINDVNTDALKLFKEVAKSSNLSQKMFDDIVSSYVNKEKALLDEVVKNHNTQIEEYKKTIGEERISRVENLSQRLGLSEKQHDLLKKFTVGIEEFEVVESILNKTDNSINVANASSAAPVDPSKAIEELLLNPEYKKRPHLFHDKLTELTRLKISMKDK